MSTTFEPNFRPLNLLTVKLLLLTIFCFFGLNHLMAQNTETDNSTPEILAFTLKEAQAYAIKNNLNAKNSQAGIRSAQGQVTEVKGIGFPQVNGSLSYQRNLKQPVSLVPAQFFDPEAPEGSFAELTFGTKNNLTATIQATQLVFDGSYLLGLKAAKLFVERARMTAAKTNVDVQKSVADAYIAALVSKENLKILSKNITVLERILFETSELYKNGFAEQLDVDRLKLSLSNLEAQVKSSERLAEISLNLLKYQMGLDLNQLVKLSDTMEEFIKDAETIIGNDVVSLQSEALQKRVELKALAVEKIFSDLDARRIKMMYLPSVSAFINGQTSFQSDDLDLFKTRWLPAVAAGLNINVPIFDGFQKKGQLQQKRVVQEQVLNQQEFTRQSILFEVSQAKTNYTTAFEQLQSQKNNLELADKIYQTTLIKYKEGVGSSLEVTSAETTLYETQGLYIQALYDLVVAKTNLEKALGNYEEGV